MNKTLLGNKPAPGSSAEEWHAEYVWRQKRRKELTGALAEKVNEQRMLYNLMPRAFDENNPELSEKEEKMFKNEINIIKIIMAHGSHAYKEWKSAETLLTKTNI